MSELPEVVVSLRTNQAVIIWSVKECHITDSLMVRSDGLSQYIFISVESIVFQDTHAYYIYVAFDQSANRLYMYEAAFNH